MPAPSPEDFGQTLGSHGVGGGFPVVLPLLGPSNLRDALGSIPDILLNPIAYIDRSSLRTGLVAGAYLNRASLHIGEYESLKRDALDPYTFLRDAYQQNRDKLIKE